jgi:putative FmdB family regulatory protein
MPTYEYECGACGHHFEQFQGIKESPVSECPECHGTVKRVVSGGGGFIMKGSGGSAPARAGNCDRETPCCGRETRCETSPCHS